MATEIGGISVTIGANTRQLDEAIARADQALSNLGGGVVTISAQVGTASIDKAVRDTRAKLKEVSKASKADPIPVSFIFGATDSAVKLLRKNVHAELYKQGGIEVPLTAMKGSEKMLVESLGPVIVPVAFVWNGEWANGVPTVEVNVKGSGGEGGTPPASEPAPKPKGPEPKPAPGSAAAEKGADQKSKAAPDARTKTKAKEPTQAQAQPAPTTGQAASPAATAAPEPAAEAAEPVAPAPPKAAKSATAKCSTCGETYTRAGDGWNQHQKNSARHKRTLRQKFAGEGEELEPRVINLPENMEPGLRAQAGTQAERGIYPRGAGQQERAGAVGAARADIVEARDLGPQPISLAKMVPGGEQNPLIQRYIAAGGDIEALKAGRGIKALPGREADFEEEFPGPGGQAFFNRERTTGVDTRTGRASGGGYAQASPTHPGEFTEPAAPGGLSREQLAEIMTQRTAAIAEQYKGTEEFKRMKGARRKVYKTPPGGGEPELVGTEMVYEGPLGKKINELKAMREDLNDPTLSEEERGTLEDIVISQGFKLGAQQRETMGGRAFERSMRKHPDAPRYGKGESRFRKLTGRKGRSPTTVEDIGVIEVRDLVLDLLETQQNREKERAGYESTSAGMRTRAIGTATGRSGSRTPTQIHATGAPGFEVPASPVAETRTQLQELDSKIKEHKTNIDGLEKRLSTIGDDAEAREKLQDEITEVEDKLTPLFIQRTEFMKGLGERKPKKDTRDPVTKLSQAGRALERATVELEKVQYEPGEGIGERHPGAVGEFTPTGQSLEESQRKLKELLGEDVVPAPPQGPPGPRQFTGKATGGEGMPVPEIIEENARLKAAAAADAEKRSARARHAANVRWEKVRAAEAAGPAAAEPEEPAAAAEPIRTAKGTKAEKAAASSGRAFFCEVCGQNVKKAGHESTAMHLNAMRRGAGTPRVAGGIDIEAEGGPAEAQKPGVFDASERISRSKIRGLLGEDVVEQIRNQVDESQRTLLDESTRIKRSARAVLEENPVRALSVAVAQIAVNIFGGRASLKRDIEIAEKEGARYDASIKRVGKIEQSIREHNAALVVARKTGTEEDVQQLEKQRGQLIGERAEAERVAGIRKKTAETAAEKVTSRRPGQIAATLAVGTVGVVAGTALFQTAMAAFQLAVEQIGIGLGRTTARMSGFEQKTGELTASLADAARANYGNVEGTVYGTLAMAGFGKETGNAIKPLIEMRTTVIAGTKAFEEQLDIVRAARNIEAGRGRGFDRALTETTGGFPIMNIGGQRSISELMEGELKAIPFTAEQLRQRQAGQAITRNIGIGGAAIGMRPEMSVDTTDVQQAVDTLGDTLDWWNEQAERGGASLQLVADSGDDTSDAFAAAARAAGEEGFAKEIERLNLSLSRKGQVVAQPTPEDFLTFLQSSAVGGTMPTPEFLRAQQERPLQAQVQTTSAMGELRRGSFLPAQQYLQQLAQPLVPFEKTVAARTPGAKDAENYDSAKASIDAAHESLRAYAAEGEKAAMASVQFADAATGGNLTGQWLQATRAVAAYGQQISSLQIGMMWKQVNLQVAQYDEQLRVANRSLADAQEFLDGIDRAGNNNLGLLERQARVYSQQSAEIGFQQQALGQQSAQLGLQNQLLGIRSKELSLQTAQLSRQSQELGFQAQANQLAMNQRQINFQQAVAGFTAPGMTPQERAARIEEAKVEAEFAQNQQDIAMEQFGIAKEIFGLEGQQLAISAQTLELDRASYEIQVQQVGLAGQALDIARAAYDVQQAIIDVNAAQAVEDLGHQIDLLTRARTVTIELAIDSENLAALQQAQAAEIAKAQDILSDAQNIQAQIISAEVQIAALLGRAVGGYAGAVLSALQYGIQAINVYAIQSLQEFNTVGGGPGDSGGAHWDAPGWIGSFKSPTQITVGDAGGEMVAVVRNPKSMTLGPGSGGGEGGIYIQVNVTGNQVRNDEDLETLSTLVARKVEQSMGRRASDYGFRVAR
jgi:hypothetical protein